MHLLERPDADEPEEGVEEADVAPQTSWITFQISSMSRPMNGIASISSMIQAIGALSGHPSQGPANPRPS
jgi:hypothetical protein